MRLAILLGGLAAGTAWAQSPPSAGLEPRVSKLESEMRAVQRKLFPGGTPRYFEPEFPAPATPSATAAPPGAGFDPKAVSEMQTRLLELERQLREITGRVEQNENQTRQLEELVKALKSDVESRLGKLELASAPPAAPTLVAPTAPSPPSKPIAAPTAPLTGTDAQYRTAFSYFEARDYDRAETAFKEFVGLYGYKSDKDRGVPLAANAQYWLGRTHVNKKAYAQAARAFLEGYQRYPKADKAPDSLLGLAESLIALAKPADACSALGELQLVYPAAAPEIKAKAQAARVKAKCP